MKWLIFSLLLIPTATLQASQWQAVPYFAAEVSAGKLPPLAHRLPETPLVDAMTDDREPGQYGGQLRMLMGKAKDIRQVTINGYSRLMVFNKAFKLEPDLLARYEVEAGRIFTFHLRPGHKWSDGHPFTSADFKFWWEDIANNPQLSPSGPPEVLKVDGESPRVSFPDTTTVRYEWTKPNPLFLKALASPKPLYIYKPAHYLKQFHPHYTDKATLKPLIKAAKKRKWTGLFVNKDRPYKATNPDLPTLQPWSNSTPLPAERFVFKRNPYYHRVDQNGKQLPYIDEVIINIASHKLIPAKAGAGESDLQARSIRLDNYTFLKQGEKQSNYRVHLWKNGRGAQVALYPNFNTKDATWRSLIHDIRFRRALSAAINRYEINQVVYFGLVTEGNNTLLKASPMVTADHINRWTSFDLEYANAMLDEMGLTQRDDRGIRLLPDGRPMEIIVQTAGESTEQTDILELIHDSWHKVGIKLYAKPSVREVFRNRIFSGEATFAIWSGIENAIANVDTPPMEFTPNSRYQYQWPQWGLYYRSQGKKGEAPSLPSVKELATLEKAWMQTTAQEEKKRIWQRILELHSEQQFTIGIVCQVPQPVVANIHLRNVPEEGFYNLEPGAYFGIYRPDSFWYDNLNTAEVQQ